MISDVHELAFDVSTEYNSLVNSNRVDQRNQKKVEESLKIAADKRLEDVRRTRQREQELREGMDSKLLEIETLKQKLKDESDAVESLQAALSDAEKEIAVSMSICLFLWGCYSNT